LGVYGDITLGRNLRAEFASFNTPKHLWSNRKNGCTWNPKGGVRLGIESFPTCPIEFDGEQCPDAFYGTCFEQIFGPGNKVKDFYATAEGQSLLAAMVRRINLGLGNSFFDLYNFANHPLITQANTGGFYNGSVEDWEDYTDQMLSGDCGGLITQLDELANAGVRGYTRDISVNATTGAFNDTFQNVIEGLISDAGPDMQTAIQSGMSINGRIMFPIIMVTPEIYDAYSNYLIAMAGTNVEAYHYLLQLEDGSNKLMRNVLRYKGMPVVRWDAHVSFDAITGAKSHRAAIVAPGVFGVLHDVDALDQWEGMGLMIEQSKMLRDKGKIYMTTTLRWGAGIADTDFVVMASNILHP
jgi:hypothetical protein